MPEQEQRGQPLGEPREQPAVREVLAGPRWSERVRRRRGIELRKPFR